MSKIIDEMTADKLLSELTHHIHEGYILNSASSLTEKTLWPLFMDGVQLPQGYIYFEAIYFLPLSSQKFLVLILLIGRMKGSVDLGATQWLSFQEIFEEQTI